MFVKYVYLVSRGLTEKEKVSRKAYANMYKVEDNLDKTITAKDKARNCLRFFNRTIPKSLIEIGEEFAGAVEHVIEEVDEGEPSSFTSSSSSASEGMSFRNMQPPPVYYPQQFTDHGANDS